VAAVGLAMLTQVDRAEGLAVVVLASVVISLGLAPVFGLTTELVVGSAPPERAGAASGISETGAELGGALGISLLGSIGIAIYRRSVSDDLPSAIPNQMVDVARDTLGGAVSVAAQLPGQLGTAVLDVAQTAFVDGMQVVAIISTILAIGVALVALTQLRDVPPPSGAETADHVPADQPTPSLTPASAPDA
jgi:DHA2 family multidrug resistance protein-like MFS transporter